MEKHRVGAKVTKRYDTAKTPYQQVLADKRVPKEIKTDLAGQCDQLNPAQIRRDILALQDQLDPCQGQAPTDPTTGQTTTAHAGIHS